MCAAVLTLPPGSSRSRTFENPVKLDGQVCVSALDRGLPKTAHVATRGKARLGPRLRLHRTENMRFMIQQQRVRPPLVARKTIRLNDDALGSASCFARSE